MAETKKNELLQSKHAKRQYEIKFRNLSLKLGASFVATADALERFSIITQIKTRNLILQV